MEAIDSICTRIETGHKQVTFLPYERIGITECLSVNEVYVSKFTIIVGTTTYLIGCFT